MLCETCIVIKEHDDNIKSCYEYKQKSDIILFTKKMKCKFVT